MLPAVFSGTRSFIFFRSEHRLEQLVEPAAALLQPHQAQTQIDHAVPDKVQHGIVFLLHQKNTSASGNGQAPSPKAVGEPVFVAVYLDREYAGGGRQYGHGRGPDEAPAFYLDEVVADTLA